MIRVMEPGHQIESFLHDLPQEAKAALGYLVKKRRMPQKMHVFAVEPIALLFLYSGQIAFYTEHEAHRPVELGRHGPGTILGLRSVLENKPSKIQAVTQEECEIGVIRAEDFRHFLEQFPAGYMAIARILGCELQSVYAMLRR
jgi:CRP-like cAMP-binding protein